MSRLLALAAVVLMATGCCVEDRAPLRLLPEDVGPRPYLEMLNRAQRQVGIATEAYYTDEWFDLEDAARALQQTARFLGKSTAAPARLEKNLPNLANDLANEASQLRQAARAKDSQKALATLQSLLVKVRSFHLQSSDGKNP